MDPEIRGTPHDLPQMQITVLGPTTQEGEIARMSIEDYEAALANGNYEAAARIVLSLPDRSKRMDTPDHFILALTRLTAASEFLKPIPTAMLTQIVQDMKPEQRERFDKLSGIILANVLKLREAGKG